MDWLKEALKEKPENELNMLYDAQTLKYPANFLAELIWQSMRETIVKAYEGMEYLQAIAGIISKQRYLYTGLHRQGLKCYRQRKRKKILE